MSCLLILTNFLRARKKFVRIAQEFPKFFVSQWQKKNIVGVPFGAEKILKNLGIGKGEYDDFRQKILSQKYRKISQGLPFWCLAEKTFAEMFPDVHKSD